MMQSTSNGRSGQAFLNGHTTDYHTKHDRQQRICTKLNQLTDDLADLMANVSEYAEEYDGIPVALVDRLYALGQAVTDGAQAVDPAYLAWLAERECDDAWNFRNHYGCEPADIQGSV